MSVAAVILSGPEKLLNESDMAGQPHTGFITGISITGRLSRLVIRL